MAKEQGLSPTAPDGLLKQFTKTVLETALNEEMNEHLRHDKNQPPPDRESTNIRNGTPRDARHSPSTSTSPASIVMVRPSQSAPRRSPAGSAHLTYETRLGDTFRENLDPADVHTNVGEYAEDQADNLEDCALVERLIQQCVDDLDGMPVAHDVNEKIEFSFRGTDYVIDLRPANAEKLKAVLRHYIARAQRIDTRAVNAESTGAEESLNFGHTEQQLQAVLSWAKMHNYAVSPSGGITKQIIQAFNAAHRRSTFDGRIAGGAGQAPG